MAYVITAVGAGGKSSYLSEAGIYFTFENKKTVITTTTHIWNPGRDAEDGIPYYGLPDGSGKLTYPGDAAYEKLCSAYDVVLVEGDGAHTMPVKLPSEGEPVIPANTNEIAVLMGKHAVGRKLKTVCHRFPKDGITLNGVFYSGEEPVTEKLLRELAEAYYLQPLKAKYPGVRIRYVLSDMERSGREKDVKKLTLVLLASGFGARFGGNKLLTPYKGKALYRHLLEELVLIADAGRKKIVSAETVNSKYGSSDSGNPKTGLSGKTGLPETEVLVVTQYDEILEAIRAERKSKLSAVRNTNAAEGISASLKLGTDYAVQHGSDALVFFAADMPELPEADIVRFIRQFLYSGKTYACMEILKEENGKTVHVPVNPGAFRIREGVKESLLELTGDTGAMRLIRRHLPETYFYQIEEEKVRDIDSRADLPGE